MDIEKIKTGDEFFLLENYHIKRYRYYSLHPFNPNYHIIIDENAQPVRRYKDDLKVALFKSYTTYKDAALALADQFEQMAKECRDSII